MDVREGLKTAKRVVVKVGTSTITRPTGGANLVRMEEIAREIAGLADEGREMVLVTSGAIAAGMNRMGLKTRPKDVSKRQALAAVGQGVLMHLYETMFASYGQTAGQVLLTKENSVRHNQYTNSRNALLAMIAMGVVPVVNENDAVSVDELKIGDNDTLSATVASLVDADALIILSDVDGLYTANPQEHPDAKLISEVREVTPEIEALAGGAGTAGGTGGMVTKLAAAKIAMSAGVTMAIARGDRFGVMREVLEGKPVGTVFFAKDEHLRARKAWLAFGRHIGGNLTVDEGCVRAMRSGASLLAAGIKSVDGDFQPKSTVRVLGPDGREIARGVVNYGANEIRRIAGKKTKEIIKILPEATHDEVIHRDNLVMMI